MNKKHKEFLRELTKLSKKHGVAIDGCGCCGSPFISERTIGGAEKYTVDDSGDRLSLREVSE